MKARNKFLLVLSVAMAAANVFAFALVRMQASGQPVIARPNILFLLADDWAWPHAGAYGDKVVKTPTFDRVAREGVLFTNAYSASPSCTPSRASMLTGRAVHQFDVTAYR